MTATKAIADKAPHALQWPKVVEITVRAELTDEQAAQAKALEGTKQDGIEIVSVRVH